MLVDLTGYEAPPDAADSDLAENGGDELDDEAMADTESDQPSDATEPPDNDDADSIDDDSSDSGDESNKADPKPASPAKTGDEPGKGGSLMALPTISSHHAGFQSSR